MWAEWTTIVTIGPCLYQNLLEQWKMPVLDIEFFQKDDVGFLYFCISDGMIICLLDHNRSLSSIKVESGNVILSKIR